MNRSMHARRRGAFRFMWVVAGACILALSHDGRCEESAPPVSGRAPTILVAAGTDSIFIKTIVKEAGLGTMGYIGSPASVDHLVLASGDSLRLDGNTPEGVYDLADGTRLTLGPPSGYPRGVMFQPKMHPMLDFVVHSRRRIGVLVASEQMGAFREPSDSALVELFRSRAQYSLSKVGSDKPLAFAIPLDWYRRSWIELPDSAQKYRVAFFGYGDVGEPPRSAPIGRLGTVRFYPGPPPARPAVALPTSAPIDLLGEVRIVTGGPAIMQVEEVR